MHQYKDQPYSERIAQLKQENERLLERHKELKEEIKHILAYQTKLERRIKNLYIGYGCFFDHPS